MTYYYPCKNCQTVNINCSHLKKIKAAVAGLSLTSIKFKCSARIPMFSTGDRVKVLLTITSPESDEGFEKVEFRATIIDECSKNAWYFIKIDNGPSMDDDDHIVPDCLYGNGYATAPLSRLDKICEPRATVCAICSGTSISGYISCYGVGELEISLPDGCIKKKMDGSIERR